MTFEESTNLPLIFIGGGKHSVVLFDICSLNEKKVLGCVDKKLNNSLQILGIDVLGDDKEILKFKPDEIELVQGIAGIEYRDLRRKIYLEMKKKGFNFAKIISPYSIISKYAFIDEGVQILSNVVVQANASIGKYTLINTGAIVEHDCKIGENTHIAPGVILNGSVVIGNNTHIGSGSVVLENIKIGDNSIIAAGSVIHKDVSDNSKIIQKKQVISS